MFYSLTSKQENSNPTGMNVLAKIAKNSPIEQRGLDVFHFLRDKSINTSHGLREQLGASMFKSINDVFPKDKTADDLQNNPQILS